MGLSNSGNDSSSAPLLSASSNTSTVVYTDLPRPTTQRIASQDSDRQCRICGDGESTSDQPSDEEEAIPGITPYEQLQQPGMPRYPVHKQQNRLIRPCRCKGSMKYIHVKCLNRWRNMSPRAASYVACDVCGYHYNIYRPLYASIVTNVYFLRLTTIVLVFAAVILSAYAALAFDQSLLGHSPLTDPDWQQWHGNLTVLGLDRFYLGVGLVMVAGAGILYMAYACARTRRHEDEDDWLAGGQRAPWFICCDQASCPWYSCYLADVAACSSGDAAAGGLLICLITMSMMAVLFGFMGAITGVYRFMESIVERVAGHVQEMILDVD
ncbi:hypothetical protein DM01DRAFT_1160001 [Hesseltinella vesiculosa]|uniref:RING-CH-type domain-containing protein n=1 Tax=Hesseltinella vesiculosa TaxID=101127 RepID=A0A1X2GSF1_9FUNG|nr:hypothetical protein DM01DRAFT_1160001 [Hesseltinella vesiculosa]